MKYIFLLIIFACQYEAIVGQSRKDVNVTIVNDELYFNNMSASQIVYGQRLLGIDIYKICEQYFEDGYQQEALNTLSTLYYIVASSDISTYQESSYGSMFVDLFCRMYSSSELYDIIENPKWLLFYDDFLMEIKRETEKLGLEYQDTIYLAQVYCVIGETRIIMEKSQYNDGAHPLTYQGVEQDLETKTVLETHLANIWKESFLYYLLSKKVSEKSEGKK